MLAQVQKPFHVVAVQVDNALCRAPVATAAITSAVSLEQYQLSDGQHAGGRDDCSERDGPGRS